MAEETKQVIQPIETTEVVTPVEVKGEEEKVLQPVQPVEEKEKVDWNEFVNEENPVVSTEVKPVQTDYYKKHFNESDWVLMFYCDGKPLESWHVKDLLERIDVKARGIRVGKTGKCYADFEDEETWKRVKELSGQTVSDLVIIVDDVPPRTEAPRGNFNRGKKKVDGEKKQVKYTKTSKFTKGKGPRKDETGENGEKKEGTDPFKTYHRKKATKKMEKFDPSKLTKKTGHVGHPQKEEEKKKVVKKVVKEPELNQEEIEEGWEVVKKGAKIGGTKKKEKKEMDGIIAKKKNIFE